MAKPATPMVRPGTEDYLKVTVYFCSECERWSAEERWNLAWGDELRRRKRDPKYAAGEDEWGKALGLVERMVCPRCKYVHADDECSYVDETWVTIEEPSPPADIYDDPEGDDA